MWWLYITIGLFGIIILILIYAIINLLRKYEALEHINNDKDAWIQQFQETINLLNERLKQIDQRGSFESDDEVGIFFKELSAIQNILNEQFIIEDKYDTN